MSGRMEHDEKVEDLIQRRLKDMPKYVDDWMIELSARGVKPKSKYDMLNKVYNFLLYIDDDVKKIKTKKITEKKVKKYIIKKSHKIVDGSKVNTSYSYQRSVRIALSVFFDYLVDQGLLEENYVSKVKKIKGSDLKRINRERTHLTKEDFDKIISAVKEDKRTYNKIAIRDYAVIMLLMNTGMRESALTEIDLSDIDLEERTLYVIDKGEIEHDYFLNEQTYYAVRDYISIRNEFIKGYSTDSLFLSKQGKRIAPNSVAYIVRKYTKRALGYELSPHKIRGGVVTILYNEWGDLELVRRAIGHADISTTQRYATTNGNEKKRMADTMNFGNE